MSIQWYPGHMTSARKKAANRADAGRQIDAFARHAELFLEAGEIENLDAHASNSAKETKRTVSPAAMQLPGGLRIRPSLQHSEVATAEPWLR